MYKLKLVILSAVCLIGPTVAYKWRSLASVLSTVSHFENLANQSLKYFPKLWVRYKQGLMHIFAVLLKALTIFIQV